MLLNVEKAYMCGLSLFFFLIVLHIQCLKDVFFSSSDAARYRHARSVCHGYNMVLPPTLGMVGMLRGHRFIVETQTVLRHHFLVIAMES